MHMMPRDLSTQQAEPEALGRHGFGGKEDIINPVQLTSQHLNIFCIYICVCVVWCVLYVCVCVRVWYAQVLVCLSTVVARGWSPMSYSKGLHFRYWGRVSHLNPTLANYSLTSLPILESPVSTSWAQELQTGSHAHSAFLWLLDLSSGLCA